MGFYVRVLLCVSLAYSLGVYFSDYLIGEFGDWGINVPEVYNGIVVLDWLVIIVANFIFGVCTIIESSSFLLGICGFPGFGVA